MALGCTITTTAGGGDGEPCTNPSGSFFGPLACNEGLMCNEGHSPPLCEAPHAQGDGGPCSDRDNCTSGLWCNDYVCTPVLALGEACPPTPTGTGCGDQLVCLGGTPAQAAHCAAAGGMGEPCGASDSCDPGLTCTKMLADGGGYGVPTCQP